MTWSGPTGFDPVSMTECLKPEDVDSYNAEKAILEAAKADAVAANIDAQAALVVAQQDADTAMSAEMTASMALSELITAFSMYTECP